MTGILKPDSILAFNLFINLIYYIALAIDKLAVREAGWVTLGYEISFFVLQYARHDFL